MDALKMLKTLAELKGNDDKIVFVSKAMQRIRDDVFVKLFPSEYGIRAINENWGMRLIRPSTLARENNNCWFVIKQMENWRRWFQLVGVKRPVQMGQRLLIETVHHTSAELSFVPNPIETHPVVDTLTSIFVSDDNMSCVDHSISIEMDSEYGQEYCEMRIGILPESGGFPDADFGSSTPLPPLLESNLDDEICEVFTSISDLPDTELITLYHLLLKKDRVIRYHLPYSIMEIHYPLRRRRLAKKKHIRESSITARFTFLKKELLQSPPKPRFALMKSAPPTRSSQDYIGF